MADIKKKPARKNKPTNQADLTAQAEELKARGAMATSGTVCAAAVMESFQTNLMGKEVSFGPIYDSLKDRVKAIQDGDLGMVDSMLFSQASALQTIFTSLARRAASQQYLAQYQIYLGLALKAQAQSRATLEALIELKQPRQQPTFVKQANIAAGHQQVNNTYASASPHTHTSSHTGNSPTEPNKLLEVAHGIELDTGAQGHAGRSDQDLAAVESVHRTAHP